MLVYRRSDTLKIVGYTDSDLAGDRDDKKYTSGYIFMAAQGVVSWKSEKQETTSSTIEAEYIACRTAAKHAIWLKKFISELKIVDSIQRPLSIFCDNQAAVKYFQNDYINDNKHINLKYLCVIDYVESKLIDIVFKSTL